MANPLRSDDARRDPPDANRDPLTGEPGSHPVGTSLGAAAAGAAGLVVGAGLGGPLGAAVGSALGVAAGAALGHNAAESANPTSFEAVEPELKAGFDQRPYAQGRDYADYGEAYRFGAQERAQWSGPAHWDDRLDQNLNQRWDQTKARAGLAWDDAREAVRDAWHAVERRLPGDADRDGR